MGTFAFKIVLAVATGIIVGMTTNRSLTTTRTFVITCIGAALLTIISNEFYKNISFPWHSDPARLSAQILAAIGFIGTGVIWMAEDNSGKGGVSVAACLWITAIMGILIGAGMYSVMIAAVFTVLFVFWFSDVILKGKNMILNSCKNKK